MPKMYAGGSMIYGYLRVSTDKQTLENQRFEIERYCKENGLTIGEWVEEKISGTRQIEDRTLGSLLSRAEYGDVIICSELSRLGRKFYMVMSILGEMLRRGVNVIAVKDRYHSSEGIESKVLAFAFGISAEIERNLIAMRTKEALALRKAQGVKLGRPRGKQKHYRIDYYKEEIEQMLAFGIPKAAVARRLEMSCSTLYLHLKRWEQEKQQQ